MREEHKTLSVELSKTRWELNDVKQKLASSEVLIDSLRADKAQWAEKNLVYVDPKTNTPHCDAHGAMLCNNEELTIWRCPGCNVGMLYPIMWFRGTKKLEV